jgi:predicted DsbA family dithiol-disulfide isomerase
MVAPSPDPPHRIECLHRSVPSTLGLRIYSASVAFYANVRKQLDLLFSLPVFTVSKAYRAGAAECSTGVYLEGLQERERVACMPVRLDVWTDYSCPYCFLATLAVEKLKYEYAVDVHWRAFQLRPPGSRPLPKAARNTAAGEHVQVAERALSEFGFVLKPGPIGINTRLAHVATSYAESIGKGDAFHLATENAYWLEGQSIETPEAIRTLAVTAGLDPDAVTAALQDLRYSRLVDVDRSEAEHYGMRGVPDMLFDSKYLLSGAQSYDTLRQTVERLQHKTNSSSAGRSNV